LLEKTIRLVKKLERLPAGRHPWIFSKGIGRLEETPEPGEVVRVLDRDGAFVGRGYFNERSKITIRLLEWNEEVEVNRSWWQEKIAKAVERRRALPSLSECDAYRAVYAEADGLPGLVVDRYADFLVFQCLTAGVERVKDLLVETFEELFEPKGIYERSDTSSRKLEGLQERTGTLWGEEPPDRVEISEGCCRFLVDLKKGQKTGFFLDQRESRRETAAFLAEREVGDFFSYTGGFSVAGLLAGARSSFLVDSSQAALDLAAENLALNRLPKQEISKGDLFQTMRRLHKEGKRFDAVVLDPPKLAPTRAHTPKALRGYKDLNLMAMRLLRPSGILATFSCSGGVSPEAFQEASLWASMDADREVRIVKTFSQAEDHPVRLGFRESAYLKGFLCVVE